MCVFDRGDTVLKGLVVLSGKCYLERDIRVLRDAALGCVLG